MKHIFFVLSFFCSALAFAGLPDFKRNPVVYGLSPAYISHGYGLKGLKAITQRLPEIKALGANIVWLQPITPPFEEDGHGYDVMEYKEVWSHLGSEQDLKKLVKEAHGLGIKLMLDVVLNHSSFNHPFIEDIKKNGKRSPYYEFYQYKPIQNVPYAQHFHKRKIGSETYIYYFWEHLLNFNYESEKLRAYLFDVLAYWVKEYDIDGYRFDASWGPSSRWPYFYSSVSDHLREIKPDIILMAEDMTGYPKAYQGTWHPHLKDSGFDWAYDWNNEDPNWISKWSFQMSEAHEETVFNHHDATQAADYFMRAVNFAHSEDGIRPVRYIENNDTPGILRYHSLKEAMWAAKVMFVLPGVPLVFYGQEAGNKHDTFHLPSFDPKKKMSTMNPKLWNFYRDLIKLRRDSELLSEGELINLRRESGHEVSFQRMLGPKVINVRLDFAAKEVYLNSKPLL